MHIVKRIGAALAVLSLAMMVAWFGFLEPPFLSYRNLPFPVQDPRVRAGTPVLLQVIRCNGDTKTRTYLISHRLIRVDVMEPPTILPAGPVSLEPGCTREVSAANTIPTGTAPGLYVVEGFAEVSGTWRTHSIRWYSEPFQVIP
jgi:hypothetical protein